MIPSATGQDDGIDELDDLNAGDDVLLDRNRVDSHIVKVSKNLKPFLLSVPRTRQFTSFCGVQADNEPQVENPPATIVARLNGAAQAQMAALNHAIS